MGSETGVERFQPEYFFLQKSSEAYKNRTSIVENKKPPPLQAERRFFFKRL
jgi:hypothetical protein